MCDLVGMLTHRFSIIRMFTADGTGSGSGAGSEGATPGAGDGAGSESGSGAPSFTAEQQAQINAEVARQIGGAVAPKVAAAIAKHNADLKALADAENQTAEQKAQAAADAARREADERIAAADKTLVTAAAQIAALNAGANPARVTALLKLADLTSVEVTDGTPDAAAIKTAIDAALKDFPEFKAAAQTGGASGGDLNSGGATTVTQAEFDKMTYADRVKLHQSHPDIYNRLTAV